MTDDPTERDSPADQTNEGAGQAESPAGSPEIAPANESTKQSRTRFAERIDEAGQALRDGRAATLAYVLGISEQDIGRRGGVTDGRDVTLCDTSSDLKTSEPG